MPSTTHEALVLLFRESPRLAPILAARALGRESLSEGAIAAVQVTSAEFAELQPPEYRADLVLRVPDSDAPERASRGVFIVEVQLRRNPDKRYSWPHYVTSARARHRCPAILVVVAPSERVADWCAQPIALDWGANEYRPVVLGPKVIPFLTDPDEARRWPELAVLSAIAHGNEPGSEAVGAAALAACDPLDNPKGNLYADLIYAHLGPLARAALEALMQQHNYTYQSDFAKKYVAEGVEQGIEQGIEQGYRTLIRKQLRQRFGELPAEFAAKLDQADADTLDTWGGRVFAAENLADVFAPKPE